MFNLHLTAEQLEFRDTVRDFVQNEVKPAAIDPKRLEPFEKPLLSDLLDYASRMGLRTLSLSEAAGGAGADTLTSCIVLEELAAGDVDIAMALGVTQGLARTLFEDAMSDAQRNRYLARFTEEHNFHLALAAQAAGSGGWNYHREDADDSGEQPTAVKQSNGDWVIDGAFAFVPNAPIAQLFVVQAKAAANTVAFLIPKGTAGLTVAEPGKAFTGTDGHPRARWYHGTGSEVRLEKCRVAADALLGKEGARPVGPGHDARAEALVAAVNLGVGRAAYDAAVEYSKIRIQGGRPIIQHQSIGAILADVAIKLELARTIIWKAAWTADNPDVVTDRSVSDLPLHTIARVYTAEAMHEATLSAAECFGAMGVMRDMPLQKYVHDAFVFLNGSGHDSATKLGIAEALAGYERAAA